MDAAAVVAIVIKLYAEGDGQGHSPWEGDRCFHRCKPPGPPIASPLQGWPTPRRTPIPALESFLWPRRSLFHAPDRRGSPGGGLPGGELRPRRPFEGTRSRRPAAAGCQGPRPGRRCRDRPVPLIVSRPRFTPSGPPAREAVLPAGYASGGARPWNGPSNGSCPPVRRMCRRIASMTGGSSMTEITLICDPHRGQRRGSTFMIGAIDRREGEGGREQF